MARIVLIVLLSAASLHGESLSGLWLEEGRANDPLRGVQYRLYRELGTPRPLTFVAVHYEVSASKQGRVYSAAPCDLWIDFDRDGVLRLPEHRRRTSDTVWCPLVGELSIIKQTSGFTLIVLAANWEGWNRTVDVPASARVTQANPPVLADGSPP